MRKPSKPIPPQEFLERIIQYEVPIPTHTSKNKDISLEKIKQKLEQQTKNPISYTDIKIRFDYYSDEGDTCYHELLAYIDIKLPNIPNPNYNKELKKYKYKLNKYNKKLQIYANSH